VDFAHSAVIYSQSSLLITFGFSRSQNVFAPCWGEFQQPLFNLSKGFLSRNAHSVPRALCRCEMGTQSLCELQKCTHFKEYQTNFFGVGERGHNLDLLYCSSFNMRYTVRWDGALAWSTAWSTGQPPCARSKCSSRNPLLGCFSHHQHHFCKQ